MSRTCGIASSVAQRHKRLERIVQKLARPSSTRLSVMQDIAGVRVAVRSLDELRRLEEHICSQWMSERAYTAGAVRRVVDYIDLPRETGYRAVHLIVSYNGRDAELQLRTEAQHTWAEAVEEVSRAISVELKAGEIPAEINEFFVEVGEVVFDIDFGHTVKWERTLDLRPWGSDLSLTVAT
ncbi:MAG: hypothetical protein JJE52_09315 [Acidimicrobiia bacterium]|nr:hypothetical protein [Acidimicrobiia bacterium]